MKSIGGARNVPENRDQEIGLNGSVKSEVGALGVPTIYRGCFERCCSNKNTPP